MNPEIKTLLESMEFHESKYKSGLWVKSIDENETGIMGVTAYIDFRIAPEKGRRFYTIERTDGTPKEIRDDADSIPTLAYFKEARDKILSYDNKTPEPKEMQGTKTPPNPNKQSQVPCVPGEKKCFIFFVGTIEDAVKLFKTYETVAINRTISDMLGGGEVSAEEVT